MVWRYDLSIKARDINDIATADFGMANVTLSRHKLSFGLVAVKVRYDRKHRERDVGVPAPEGSGKRGVFRREITTRPVELVSPGVPLTKNGRTTCPDIAFTFSLWTDDAVHVCDIRST